MHAFALACQLQIHQIHEQPLALFKKKKKRLKFNLRYTKGSWHGTSTLTSLHMAGLAAEEKGPAQCCWSVLYGDVHPREETNFTASVTATGCHRARVPRLRW